MRNDEIVERLDRIEKLLQVQEPKPMNFEEAREYLGCSRGFLYKMTSKNLIPHFKPRGKEVYFLKLDLDAYMTKNRVRSKDEIRREVENG